NLSFDFKLGLIGKLITIAAEDLDTVVLPGIVRGGDDHAGGKAPRVRQVGNAGRGDDSCALHRNTGLAEAAREGVGYPGTRFAGVLANHQAAGALRKVVAKGPANGMNGRSIQGVFPRQAADSIGPEKLSHPSTLLFFLPQRTQRTQRRMGKGPRNTW